MPDDLPDRSQTSFSLEAWRGMKTYASRSCGDCADGPPCRCYSGHWSDSMTVDEMRDINAWLTWCAENGR